MMRTVITACGVVLTSAAIVALFDPNTAGDVLLLVAAAVSWTFTTLYATRSRWRLLNAGRSLLYVMLSLSIVLTQNAASAWFGLSYPWRGELRVLMYLSLSLALVGMLRTLWRIQHRDVSTRSPERFLTEDGQEL